jgi:hypothetical protein
MSIDYVCKSALNANLTNSPDGFSITSKWHVSVINTVRYMFKKIAAQLGGTTIQDSIDVRGLDQQDVSLIEALVERLRERARKKKEAKAEKESTVFATWPLGAKGRLTRKEIYDYL